MTSGREKHSEHAWSRGQASVSTGSRHSLELPAAGASRLKRLPSRHARLPSNYRTIPQRIMPPKKCRPVQDRSPKRRGSKQSTRPTGFAGTSNTPGTLKVLSRCSPGALKLKVLSRCSQGSLKVVSRYSPGALQVLSRYLARYSQGALKVLSQGTLSECGVKAPNERAKPRRCWDDQSKCVQCWISHKYHQDIYIYIHHIYIYIYVCMHACIA